MAAITISQEQVNAELFEDSRGQHRTWDRVEPVLGLFPREVLLLRWAAEGLSGTAVADLAGVSKPQVEGYWARLLAHLKVSTRAAAVAAALRAGVIQ